MKDDYDRNTKNDSAIGIGPWFQRITLSEICDSGEYDSIDEIVDSRGRVIFSECTTSSQESELIEKNGSQYLRKHSELVDVLNKNYNKERPMSDKLFANGGMPMDELLAREDELVDRISAVIRTVPFFKNCKIERSHCTNHRYDTLTITDMHESCILNHWYRKFNDVIDMLYSHDMYMLNFYINLYMKRGDETEGDLDVSYSNN